MAADDPTGATPPEGADAVLRAPITLSQRSSLLMSSHSPSREFMSWVYQLNGKLDVDALARAVDDAVERHDMLRVRFGRTADGEVEQFVTPFHPGVLRIVRLDDRDKLLGLTAAVRSIEADYQDLSPWDDSRLQATLYLLTPKTNVLSVFVAEALIDGDSGTLVAAEISRAYAKYANKPAPELREPSDASFLRYALEHPVKPEVEQRAEAHWRSLIDRPRTTGTWPMTPGERNAVSFFKITRPEWDALATATPALGSTPYVVLLSLLEMALCRVAGAEEFLVTSAISNRRLPVTRGMIGNFVGPVRMVAEVHPDDSLEDVSARVMAALRPTIQHSILPIPLAEARVQAPAPYVPSLPYVSFFLFDEREGLDLAGVRQRRFRVHTGTRDVLRVNCTPDEEGGRNFFFISSSAPRALLDELASVFRSLLEGTG